LARRNSKNTDRTDRPDQDDRGDPAPIAGPPADSRGVTPSLQLNEAHRQLEDARDRYVELYDFSPVPLLTVDRVGLIREVSQGVLDLFVTSRGHLLGLPLASLAIERDRSLVRKHVLRCRTGGHKDTVTLGVSLALPDGATHPVKLVSRQTAAGREAYLTALVDETERKGREADRERLREAERAARQASEAKDLFISVLSHELRSPLTAISAAAGALERGEVEPMGLVQLARTLRRNVAIQSRLVDDLLDVTRVMRRKLRIERRPTDLHEIAQEVLATLEADLQARKLAVHVELHAGRHNVLGDGLRLHQVFWNLLHNAIKFTPPGGTVCVRSWNKDRRIVVEVSDTGVGMAPELLESLFRPFEQAASGSPLGLGLGLAITKGIVELHDGQIVAASPGVGRGTRFVIELDLCDQALPAVAAPPLALAAVEPAPTRVAESDEPRPRTPRILIVDDNPDIAQLLGNALAAVGYQVDVATSFAAAVIKDFAKVDLVVSDVELADGSGLELVRQVRAQRKLAAIALSGYASPDDVRASRDAGFAAHLKKPIDMPVLLAAIEKATGTGPPRRQALGPLIHGRGNA
jgi:PAS domain S-box-containing protein